MPDVVTDPTAKRGYLADPNYYRLGYQLAAQIMHREEIGEKRGALFEKVSDIMYGERKARESYRSEAQSRAEEIAVDANAFLDWYDYRYRQTRRWGIFPRQPSKRKERLEQFLRRTVLPCLTIVIAASLRRGHPAEAEAKIAPLRRRAEVTRATADKEEPISYRSLYNLACYEAGAGNAAGREAALRYLAEALERAPGGRRQELGRWATKDPSLDPLREMPALEELLEPFASA
jgi:hypothetical protein